LSGKSLGFVESIKQGHITSLGLPSIRLPAKRAPVKEEVECMEIEEEKTVIETTGRGSAQLGEPDRLANPAHNSSTSDDETSDDSDASSVEVVAELSALEKKSVVEDIGEHG
jgi:hypothetical protein